ncbi:hydroxymethylbilane synthase [Domibacillus epiphyticus]|uniref:Porphobilinogen deaminase n=1 Tax=Domibacillus epiphyticus TaxID=1714355 RepID=A0A1V2A951_9BACI|nr:hydroxymethylbilane synthase [Domibacillus epiphyticus]OMP67535.1 hydroxymethylbilane synthase [Domibacillus epiphyticus]
MRKIIVGSRKSRLALTQTNQVIDQLKKLSPETEFEVREIVTKGDRILDVTLSKVGGKGLFVKEIEQAMFDGEIDMAVHSMKDMPAVLPEGLVIGAVPAREDHRDAFISKGHATFRDLPSGSIIGTSSLRRAAQLLSVRSDIEIKWIRGNIDTRLQKLENEEYDAIILAAAGLARMGWSSDVVTEFLDDELSVPAVGQGALAIECRENDSELLELLAKFTCENTKKTTTAERAFLSAIDGGCQVPVAGFAKVDGENLSLTALVASSDGNTVLKETVTGSDAEQIGIEAARLLKERGAAQLIEAARAESQ